MTKTGGCHAIAMSSQAFVWKETPACANATVGRFSCCQLLLLHSPYSPASQTMDGSTSLPEGICQGCIHELGKMGCERCAAAGDSSGSNS